MNSKENSWDIVLLGDILTNQQIKEIMYIWEKKGEAETKEYFLSIKDELAKKGIDAMYLYYAFQFFISPSLN